MLSLICVPFFFFFHTTYYSYSCRLDIFSHKKLKEGYLAIWWVEKEQKQVNEDLIFKCKLNILNAQMKIFFYADDIMIFYKANK